MADRARLAAQGLDAIGGPARLTRAELEGVNRTIQTGIDAFRALGQQAPKDVQRVADAIEKQRKALQSSPVAGGASGSSLSSSLLRSLPGGSALGAGGLTAGLAAGAAGAAGTLALAAQKAIDYADAITKASDRTGIGVVALQRLEAVGLASGNSLDQITSGVNAFQKRLSEGSSDTTNALKAIGLSVEQLRNLSPDEQFFAIARGVAAIKDPAEQTRIAMELFGRAGAELLPSLKSNVEELADATVTMSAESIKALDDFGDAMGRLKTSSLNVLGEILASGLKVLGVFKDLPGAIADAKQEAAKGNLAPTTTLGQAVAGVNIGLSPFFPTLGNTSKATALRNGLAQIPGPPGKDIDLSGFSQLPKIVPPATSEIEAFDEALKESIDRSLKASAALKAVNERIAQLSAPVQRLTDRQIALVGTYTKLGLSNDEIATKLGVTKTTIDALDFRFGKLNATIRQLETGATRGLSSLTSFGKLEEIKGLADELKLLQDIRRVESSIGNNANLSKIGESATVSAPEVRKLDDSLDDLARSLAQVAQVSGDAFGGILKGASQAVTGVSAARDAVKSIQTGKKTGGLTGALDIAGGVAALAGLVAPLVSGLVSAITGGPEWKKFKKDVARDLGVSISDGLAQALEDDSKKFGRQAAELLNLDKIIGEAGGIEDFGLDKALKGARDLFSMLETGKLSASQVGKTFDNVFGQLIPVSIDKTTGLASKQFLELEKLADRFGLKSKQLSEFRIGQIGDVTSGLGAFLSNSRISTQGSAGALGASFAAAFSELQKQGVPTLQIIKELTPAIDQMKARLKESGFEGGAAFESISRLAALASDEIAGPAIDAISGLRGVFTGLANTGLLTEETFDGLNTQVAATFAGLVEQGKSGDDALRLMQPTLQTIFELQEKFGFSVDNATQDLLDQAKAQGIVGDQFKSAQDKMVDALGKTNDILTAIADKLGAKLPEAARRGAASVEDAFSHIPDDIQVNVHWDVDDLVLEAPELAGAATGGRVTANGIQHFGRGGVVLPFFRPRGTDTVPAMLTPGEMILNAAQQGRVAGALAGATATPAVYHNHIHLGDQELMSFIVDTANNGVGYEKFSRLVRRIITDRKIA